MGRAGMSVLTQCQNLSEIPVRTDDPVVDNPVVLMGAIPVNSWAQSLCTHGVRVLKMILALGHDECYRLDRCCERRSGRGPGDEIT